MYGKIFDSIYTGTLYGQWEAIVTFQQLITLCDADGIVDMTPPAIAAVTSIPLEIIQKGLDVLSAPDPYSRTPGSEGRRIELIDAHRPWGWSIVNHSKYKSMQDAETVRAQTRERVRRHREMKRNETESNGSVTGGNATNAQKRHTDTDTDTDTDTKSKALVGAPAPDSSPVIETLPLINGKDFEVRQSLVAELEPIYPKVDVPATVREMKGWLIGNPARRKTRTGIKRFITTWLHNEQQKAEAQ